MIFPKVTNMNNRIPETLDEMYDDVEDLFIRRHDQLVRELTDYLCLQYFSQEVPIKTREVVAKMVVEKLDGMISEWFCEGSYLDFDY